MNLKHIVATIITMCSFWNINGQLAVDPNSSCSPDFNQYVLNQNFAMYSNDDFLGLKVASVPGFQLAGWNSGGPGGLTPYANNGAYQYTGASTVIDVDLVYSKKWWKDFDNFGITDYTVKDLFDGSIYFQPVAGALPAGGLTHTFKPSPGRIYQFKVTIKYSVKENGTWYHNQTGYCIFYMCIGDLASNLTITSFNDCGEEHINVGGFLNNEDNETYYAFGKYGNKIKLESGSLTVTEPGKYYFWRYDVQLGEYSSDDNYIVVEEREIPNEPIVDPAQLCGYQEGNITLTAQATNATDELYWLTSDRDRAPGMGYQGNSITLEDPPYGRHWVVAYDPQSGCQSNAVPVQVENCYKGFALKSNKKYIVSAWLSYRNIYESNLEVDAQVNLSFYDGNDNLMSTVSLAPSHKVDLWEKLVAEFTPPAGAKKIKFEVQNNHSKALLSIDDVRIMPFDSEMVNYVYDPSNLRLKAKLDRDNMATIYGYDEEGNLIKTNVETYQGRRTLMESRVNIAKQQ